MGKQKIDIEYPLAIKSPALIWEQISSAHGLERWFADHVNEQDVREAHVLESATNDHIRLKWDEEDDDTYFEMRIAKSELTHQLNLLITDFADDDDVDGLKVLWESMLDRLHRASGL